jgi:Tfp pilus assembly protein PilN
MKIAEITTVKSIKPLTPDQARIDSLKKQKDAATQRLKAERDRQKRQKAVQQLASLNGPLKTA